MKPEELANHLTEATGSVDRHEILLDQLAVYVSPDNWQAVGRHLRECGRCHFDYFTFLSAVDLEEEGLEVICHVYSIRRQHHINMKVRIPRDGGRLRTLSDVWGGANWHERETWEMFGIVFEGHPHLVKLYLTEDFEGNPLRKDFLLMTREAKEWPGAKEPEEKKEHAG